MPCSKTVRSQPWGQSGRETRRPRVAAWSGFLCAVLAALGPAIVAQDPEVQVAPEAAEKPRQEKDLSELSLEALLEMEVTSVSKRAQKLVEAAAAITVIRNEDIRRAGAESIAEALRLAPGMQVASITRNTWAISARGFNDEFANKLLVLMDGRTVYTPLFSGVYWDVQDTMLEDLDRIEVIRGPGAALWGANAVNGVINILTRSAKDTQGWLLKGGWGTEDNGWGEMRYGGTLGEDAWFRVYAKYFNRDGFVDGSGNDVTDDWDTARAGFRADFEPSSEDTLTVQGDVYDGGSEQTGLPPTAAPPFFRAFEDTIDLEGSDLLARWTRVLSPTSELSLQAYYDRTARDNSIFREHRDTFDLDFQHRFEIWEASDLTWGLGYRVTFDETEGSDVVFVQPDERSAQLFSLFLQDEIELVPDTLKLTLGSKLEHNDYTGFEIQPDARLLWRADEHQTLWAAFSRAVRTPARAEHDVSINFASIPPSPVTPPGFLRLLGDNDFHSEEVLAWQLGYRVRPADNLSFDLALFYNDYDELRTFTPGAPFVEPVPGGAVLIVPHSWNNDARGETYGVELSAEWQVLSCWRLAADYSFLQIQIHEKDTGGLVSAEGDEGDSPHHQFNVRSWLDLGDAWQLNTVLYYVDNLPASGIHSYLRWDAQVRYEPCENAALSVGVQNILDDRHPEFRSSLFRPASEVERMGYVSLEVRF